MLIHLKNQEDCDHSSIRFGSGDYFLFCQSCKATWRMENPKNDYSLAMQYSNQGIGGTLSGEERHK